MLNASRATQEYERIIDAADKEELENLLSKAIEYNEELEGNLVHDPFLQGSGMVMAKNHLNVLDINGNGMMGYIIIPKINLELPIFQGTSQEILRNGIGHLEGSSLPIGGETTHSILSGHTGMSSARLFTDLPKLAIGDEFYLYVLNMTLAYRVDQIKVVEPEDVELFRRISGEDYCSLITCTPYGVYNLRLVVRGTRVIYDSEMHIAQMESNESIWGNIFDKNMLVGVVTGILVWTILVVINIIKRRIVKQKG